MKKIIVGSMVAASVFLAAGMMIPQVHAETSKSVRSPFVTETYTAGETMTIKYETSHFGSNSLISIKLGKKSLSPNVSAESVMPIASGLQAPGSYLWNIPQNLPAAANYVILICQTGAPIDTCGQSTAFRLAASPAPSPAINPVSSKNIPRANFMANVFYSLGDIASMIF